MSKVYAKASFVGTLLEFHFKLGDGDTPSIRQLIKAGILHHLKVNPCVIFNNRVKVQWAKIPNKVKDLPQGFPREDGQDEECPVCLELYTNNKFTYKCTHSLCKDCAEKITGVTCPICRQNFLDLKTFYCLIPKPPKCVNCDIKSYNLLDGHCLFCMITSLDFYLWATQHVDF